MKTKIIRNTSKLSSRSEKLNYKFTDFKKTPFTISDLQKMKILDRIEIKNSLIQ